MSNQPIIRLSIPTVVSLVDETGAACGPAALEYMQGELPKKLLVDAIIGAGFKSDAEKDAAIDADLVDFDETKITWSRVRLMELPVSRLYLLYTYELEKKPKTNEEQQG